jgi:uncharacterized protein (TIGR00255 family)
MIQSMTGFASKSIIITGSNQKKSSVSAHLKSLNSRFFELTCKLPPAINYLETVILKKLKNRLKRGHVYFTIYIGNPQIFLSTIEPALSNIESYVTALEKIKKEYNINQIITLDHILRLPSIFSTEELCADVMIEEAIIQLIDELAEQVLISRNAEGADILTDLAKRSSNLNQIINAIEIASHSLVQKTKEKIHATSEKIRELQTPAEEPQISSLYALLDKIDVHEEISRFKSHLANLTEQLHQVKMDEKGKLFDFILQELMRETNTISAKCLDAIISSHAIDAKVEIEKMREQVQNIV